MEETYARLVEQIVMLKDGTADDMYALSQEVVGFCKEPESFQVLNDIINQNTDEHVQKYAITLLKYCLASMEHSNVVENLEINSVLIQTYFNLKSIDLATHMINNIFDIFQSSLHYDIGQNFLQMTESLATTDIEKKLLYLQCLCKTTKSVCDLQELAEHLITQALQTNSTARITALELGIQYYNILENQEAEHNLLNTVYDLMGQIDEESLIVLCTIVNWCANGSIDVFDPLIAISKLLDVINSETYTIKGIKAAHCTISIILENYIEDLIKNIELLTAITDVTFAIANEQFSEGDPLDLFPLDTFEIFKPFTEDSEVIAHFAGYISNSLETSIERFCFCGFLNFTIEDEILYYEQEFDTMIEALMEIIQDENLAVRELACRCLTKIAKIAQEKAYEKAPEVEAAVYELFMSDQSSEMLKAVESILESFGNTSSVFEEITSDLLEVFDESCVEYQQIIMNTLGALIDGSSDKSSEHFDELIEFFITKATSDTEASLLSDIVYCIGKMANACPAQMESEAERVFALLLEASHQESPSIIKSAVNSLGFMLTTFPEYLNDEILDQVFRIVQMNVGPDELDDPSNVALRVATMIIGTHPELAEAHAELLYEIIRQKGNSDAAKASIQLLSAFVTFPPDNEFFTNMIGKVSCVLIDIVENGSIDAVGYAMDALAIVFNRLVVETQQNLACLACRAFTYELPSLASHHEYSEDVHTGAKVLLVASIHSQALGQVQELIPQLVSIIIDGSCKQMRATVLAILAEYIEAVGSSEEGLSEEFIGICADEAKAQASEGGYIGFFCLSKLVRATGWDERARIQLAGEALALAQEVLSKEYALETEEVLILLDNALSCMGTVEMTFPDAYPIENVAALALSLMPIRMDLDEYSNVMQFLLFIVEKMRESLNMSSVIRVLANVFSESVEDLGDQMLEPELIDTLAELFKSLQEDASFQAVIAEVVGENEVKAENINAVLGAE